MTNLAERANGDTALFAAIENVILNEPNGSTAADKVQDVFVAWLRAADGITLDRPNGSE